MRGTVKGFMSLLQTNTLAVNPLSMQGEAQLALGILLLGLLMGSA
jgi:hypothetical protein